VREGGGEGEGQEMGRVKGKRSAEVRLVKRTGQYKRIGQEK